jgi:hypothetical protein
LPSKSWTRRSEDERRTASINGVWISCFDSGLEGRNHSRFFCCPLTFNRSTDDSDGDGYAKGLNSRSRQVIEARIITPLASAFNGIQHAYPYRLEHSHLPSQGSRLHRYRFLRRRPPRTPPTFPSTSPSSLFFFTPTGYPYPPASPNKLAVGVDTHRGSRARRLEVRRRVGWFMWLGARPGCEREGCGCRWE